MNEADTSNNRAVMEFLNSANSLQPEQASCPFYSVVPSENTASQLPLLKPAEDKQHDPPAAASSPTIPTQPDWVAEPDNEKQTLIDAEFQKLLALNQELRTDNNDLYQQVEHLQDDLAESVKALEWQKRRSSVTESMLNQQAQELAAAQEQIQSLFQQLETATQTVQRQEIFIDTYKAQLQISQQRLAQLERECALLQTNYNEQSQQVLQSDNACRELRTRLMRQQRQTLQFKAALEKCLDTTVPSYDSLDETANNTPQTASHQTRFSKKARSLFPNVQPIRPWSAEPESFTNKIDYPWGKSSPPPSYGSNYPTSNPSSPWNWPNQENTPTPSQPPTFLETDEPTTSEGDFPSTPENISSLESSKLDEQLDSLIQMFFTSQSATASSASPNVAINVDSDRSDVPVWETWATTLEDDEEAETSPEEELVASEGEVTHTTSYASLADDFILSSENNSSLSFTLPVTKKTSEEPENDLLKTSQVNQVELSETELPQESYDNSTYENQSPSPVVYPERPPKGRTSLSSVELPNFRPNSQ
ncbi:hypothetical protein I8752_21435 [Nostocaceae cyanobacterium CENA369]|uniref:Uncharacterized protein n=1 Tax=Dendronalium phyllosphericum CENA369 TaxID=1725256 RepID=A0A8J7I9H8_9NOST|nr:hypothetical protein [Dendronalium phyllosphericum]MBH8575525.1 hypothetical protein [Dendronalium phyllosphericum CENA369]